jgi:hypothetical protein
MTKGKYKNSPFGLLPLSYLLWLLDRPGVVEEMPDLEGWLEPRRHRYTLKGKIFSQSKKEQWFKGYDEDWKKANESVGANQQLSK